MMEMISTLGFSLIHKNRIGLPVFNEEDSKWFEDYFFGWMGLWSLCIAIGLLLLVVGCSYLIDKNHQCIEKIANRYLTHAFVTVWLLGFVVYNIGMYTGEPWSLLGNVPMAIIHAFGIFILNSDVSAIQHPFNCNTGFTALFSLTHLLAALVSLVFVLKNFGYEVNAAIRRCFGLSQKDITYIFWGMNDETYYLAKDIKYCMKGNQKYRIVIVRTNQDSDEDDNNGMERVFNFVSLKSRDFIRLKEIDGITTSTYLNLAKIDLTQFEGKNSIDILRKILRLKSLCRMVKKTKRELHLFFLSDDDEGNIHAITNLRKDSTIQSFAKTGKVKFYCNARYNSVNRVIEDELIDENTEVKVVDSSHVSVELMKYNPQYHPVNYVRVEKDATVSSPFNALVIGFGEVGIDIVSFLYEFGAFVKHKNQAGNVERSEFCCHVVDKNINNLAGTFTANAPAIAYTMNRKEIDVAQKINFYSIDYNSADFYERLRNWIKDLNYIVLATEDDETNISLAIRIFCLAIRDRGTEGVEKRLKNFRIMVRVQKDENGYKHRIAHYYNRIWAANENSTDGNQLHQHTIQLSEEIDTPITLFGSLKQTFTYNHIVNESLKENAKMFKQKYDQSMNELRKKAGEGCSEIISWEEEQNRLLQLTGKLKGYAPTFSSIMKLRRIQYQNLINSLHKYTKILLARKALGDKTFNEMIEHGLIREEGCTSYSWREGTNIDKEHLQRVLDVLAQTEHLRWNASHEILGYKKHGSEDFKDEARLLHGCLKEWEELSTRTQSYDYNIVDVSLEKETLRQCNQ
jgi:hypothetical protein